MNMTTCKHETCVCVNVEYIASKYLTAKGYSVKGQNKNQQELFFPQTFDSVQCCCLLKKDQDNETCMREHGNCADFFKCVRDVLLLNVL